MPFTGQVAILIEGLWHVCRCSMYLLPVEHIDFEWWPNPYVWGICAPVGLLCHNPYAIWRQSRTKNPAPHVRMLWKWYMIVRCGIVGPGFPVSNNSQDADHCSSWQVPNSFEKFVYILIVSSTSKFCDGNPIFDQLVCLVHLQIESVDNRRLLTGHFGPGPSARQLNFTLLIKFNTISVPECVCWNFNVISDCRDLIGNTYNRSFV